MNIQRSKSRNKGRNSHGASIALVALGALLIVIAIFAAFQLAVYMGGSRELRNSVDAAALNVSKRMVEVKLPPDPMFSDIADTTGNVGLTNINRLWAKAYLINANEEAMQKEGYSTGASNGAASSAFQAAQATNDQLHTMLSSKTTGDQFFKQMAANKPAHLLENGGAVSTNKGSSWSTAMVNRGDESNISFNALQMPVGVTPSGFNQNGKTWLRGYTPMAANGKYFCFTTFRNNEMPHLISDAVFKTNQAAVPETLNPIPNAFRESGEASAMQSSISAAAAAVANPQRQYDMAIPHSYVTISIANIAKWIVQGKQLTESQYYFTQETQQKVIKYPLKAPASGKLDGYASLGNEYAAGGNLWTALNALPGDHSAAVNRLVQRVNEFKPGFTLAQLQTLMQSQPLDPKLGKYFIFPVYSTADSTNPQVKVASETGQLPPWLRQGPGEGLEKPIITEATTKDKPNYCWDIITEGKITSGKHWTEVSGQIYWQPGTGAGQCLGNLRIARETDIFFTGMQD